MKSISVKGDNLSAQFQYSVSLSLSLSLHSGAHKIVRMAIKENNNQSVHSIIFHAKHRIKHHFCI